MALPLIHPGEILREKLATLDVKAAELSRQINVPANRLTQIMKGLRSVTGDTALRLGHWFEMDPHFWMQLQSTYDIRLAAQKASGNIAALPTHTTHKAEQDAQHRAATMQTIAITNQAGGVGKTMLAVHLAWYLAEGGARVLFVDLDGLGSATKVLRDERQIGQAANLFEADATMPSTAEVGISVMGTDTRIERVRRAQVFNVVRNFKSIGTVFDYCVVDTPSAWDARNFAAMTVCDHLLAPIELKSFALDGVGWLVRSIAAVEEEGRQGRPINFLGLIASRFNGRDACEHSGLRALREKGGTKTIFPGVLTIRDEYEQAMNDRVPVWTIKSFGAKVAGAEIRAILATVRERISATRTKKEA